MTVRHDGLTVDWLGYATARIEGDATVYTDPGRYGVLTGDWEPWGPDAHHPSGGNYDARDGDLVVVTHDHHYDSDGVRRVAADGATVLVYEAVSAENVAENSGRDVEPPEDLPYDVRRVAYGDRVTVAGVEVEVVPAYNRSDGPRADAGGNVGHPRGFGCGFRFVVDGVPCLWTGDSDAVEEHRGLDVSLLLVPISRALTMGEGEAADLAADLDPDLALPIHYDTFERLAGDSRAFAADVASRSVPVVLDERGHRA